jgi:hypothetical protein
MSKRNAWSMAHQIKNAVPGRIQLRHAEMMAKNMTVVFVEMIIMIACLGRPSTVNNETSPEKLNKKKQRKLRL